MKRTLITKLSTDVTDFTDAQIKAYSEFLRVSFAGGFKDISFEISQENEEDKLAKFLQSIRAEFRESDASPGIRIESNGKVQSFDVNDVQPERSDERPRD